MSENHCLAEFDSPETEKYIVLTQMNQEENDRRFIHVINVRENHCEFMIGKSKEADIPINDITTTEEHAKIVYD